MLRTLGALIVLALALSAPAAQAGEESGGGISFEYLASPGEHNHVVLTTDGSHWILTDTVPITVDDEDCTQPTADSVTCPIHRGGGAELLVDLSGGAGGSFRYAAKTVPGPAPLEVDLGPGTNSVAGSPRRDTISGGSGNDTIDGEGGNDEITGGGGTDTLRGGPGDDHLDASGGHGDTLVGGPGRDRIDAGRGDRIDARDGKGNDDVGCEGPAKRLRYDAHTALRVFNDSFDTIGVLQCYRKVTGSAGMHAVPRRPHFTVGRHTRRLKLRLACPRGTTFGCAGIIAELEIFHGPRTIAWGSPTTTGRDGKEHGGAGFFILPGRSLTIPLVLVRGSLANVRPFLREGDPRALRWDYQRRDPDADHGERDLENIKLRLARDHR